MDKDLSFKGNDPGATRYGNFINYYDFHPPESRIESLPDNLWNGDNGENDGNCAILDIGCNCGKLTVELHNFIKQNSSWESVSTLGVDIDDTLITRAKELNVDGVLFQCLDVTSTDNVLQNYLKSMNKERFNIVFCFSTTMWIHLNEGDEGLKTFLERICSISDFIVIEPQPWKCYRNAEKRMKKASQTFPLYKDLKIKDIEIFIENKIIGEAFTKVLEVPARDWDRKIFFFKRRK